ncbi:hypothetical protein AAGF08_08800 [Algoriphagus sp. SE2]|uniref:hypothetical protein n=1 Tax=Algoriphagus sp. SE2 TaxID=3141536 RepID=UPI0031CD5FA6
MPKPHTFPTLFDNALQISISKLKEWGYLHPHQIMRGTITWSRNGNQTGSISINVNTEIDQQFVELEYKFNGKPRKYKVRLVSMRSNLGKGRIWFFLCPQTKKRCRKLYSIGGYFFHREAFRGCMYEAQTQSKKYRQIEKRLKPYFQSEQLYEQLYKKHNKKTYAGKPTKKFLRLKEQIEKAESVSHREIELLMVL